MKIWYYTSSEHILRKPGPEVLCKDKSKGDGGMGWETVAHQTRPIIYYLVVAMTEKDLERVTRHWTWRRRSLPRVYRYLPQISTIWDFEQEHRR